MRAASACATRRAGPVKHPHCVRVNGDLTANN
jgi:hypothetical protein